MRRSEVHRSVQVWRGSSFSASLAQGCNYCCCCICERETSVGAADCRNAWSAAFARLRLATMFYVSRGGQQEVLRSWTAQGPTDCTLRQCVQILVAVWYFHFTIWPNGRWAGDWWAIGEPTDVVVVRAPKMKARAAWSSVVMSKNQNCS